MNHPLKPIGPLNLLANLPGQLSEELIEILVEHPGLRIERIVSTGQASPPGFWYQQPEHEFVLLLHGTASLTLEREDGGLQQHRLQPGDWLLLPAHCRHRVDSTAADTATVWLALFYAAT